MEDLSKRTLKELLTLARERFGSDAARLKTRAELLDALSRKSPSEAPVAAPAAAMPVSVAPVPVNPAPAAPPAQPGEDLVVRDFFRRRS